jgi:hypothetical protein
MLSLSSNLGSLGEFFLVVPAGQTKRALPGRSGKMPRPIQSMLAKMDVRRLRRPTSSIPDTGLT